MTLLEKTRSFKSRCSKQMFSLLQKAKGRQIKVILLGPPGSGKGTQAKTLSKVTGLVHISTGDILRRAIKNNTSLGVKARGYVESGELVPDSLVTKMVIERLSQEDADGGFILDGFPRNIQQAKDLGEVLGEKGLDSLWVIYLDVSEKTLTQRLGGRRVCCNCHAVFHLTNMPPKKDMLCDFCQGQLYQRQDDREATIKNRLAVYNQQTRALVDYYSQKGRLFHVRADEAIDVVLTDMFKVLKKQ